MMDAYIYGLMDKSTLSVFYVGSTTWELKSRLQNHRACAKTGTTSLYKHIRENKIDFDIVLVKDVTVKNKIELRKVERQIIKEYLEKGIGLKNVEFNHTITKKPKSTLSLVTIKVTELAASNFRIASALSGKTQYEVSEEASHFVHGKYLKK